MTVKEEELLKKYTHTPEEFPVLMEQTHKVLCDRKIVNERININENIIHYVQDTALLISVIDGRVGAGKTYGSGAGEPYGHVIYLDKSARPVSWLVNLFWEEFAAKDADGIPIKRPGHSYLNIDRSPWFRNVGINVSDDGRQKENGELATYQDFTKNIGNLDDRHIAEIRALYIEGGIEKEDGQYVLETPTALDGKRILVVDEVSRTGSTLDIAKHLVKLAIPEAAEVDGAYFWHPREAPLKVGSENVLTSLPVWYDPNTLEGRGIGSPAPEYYRGLYEHYLEKHNENPNINIKKFRTYAFSGSVYSAPLLDDGGMRLGLAAEKKTRMLCRDLRKLHDEYEAGRLFFAPPSAWADFEECDSMIEKQGVFLLPWDASEEERRRLRESPLFYPNFLGKLRKS